MLCSTGAWSWQAAGSKPSSNPLSSLLKEKPKAQVVAPELPAAIPEQPLAIPLPDVAARSIELGQKLRDASAQLPTSDQIESLQKDISDNGALIDSKLEEANRMLAGSPNSLEVREEENYWRGMAAFTASWQQQLLTWANDAQATVQMVDTQEPIWSATLDANRNNHELGPVLTVLESNLAELRSLRKQAQAVLQTSVKLQVQVGSFDQTAGMMVSQLSQVRLKLKGHLLDRDSLPLWKLSSRRQAGESPGIIHSVNSRVVSVVYYLAEQGAPIIFLLLVLIGSLVTAKHLHSMVRDKQPADEIAADAYHSSALDGLGASATLDTWLCSSTLCARHSAGLHHHAVVCTHPDYPSSAAPQPHAGAAVHLCGVVRLQLDGRTARPGSCHQARRPVLQ